MNDNSPSGLLERMILGLLMLIGGLWWLISRVSVTTGFWGFGYGYGGMMNGVIIIPLAIGIVWVLFNHKSIIGKIILVLGAVILIASIIGSTRLYFLPTSLFQFIAMIVLIFGGAILLASVLLTKPKE